MSQSQHPIHFFIPISILIIPIAFRDLTDKGITTNYLPSNTVTIKAVEGPQITRFDRTLPSKPLTKYTGEYNYNFM